MDRVLSEDKRVLFAIAQKTEWITTSSKTNSEHLFIAPHFFID
jgi:hypothetical protein